jgi:type 1 glutamine amidotransferase
MMLLFILTLFLFTGFPDQNNDPQAKKALIYTKNGEGYVHENIAASVDALKKICQESGVSCEVSEDPAIFSEGFSEKFDLVIFSNTNNEAFDNQNQRRIFQEFIRGGGGFVGIHSACGSERDWPWFWAMIGGKFKRHPPFQSFDIKVIDPDNPATDFLGKIWQWEDECYYIDHLNPDMHVLLAADLSTIEDPEKDVYPGTTFGELFPLAWIHEYDGGRQFFTALGHDPAHYEDPYFAKHLKGGITWVLQINKNE